MAEQVWHREWANLCLALQALAGREQAAVDAGDPLDLRALAAPNWPWPAVDCLQCAAQVALAHAVTERLLPALARLATAQRAGAFAGAPLTAMAQAVRNSLAQIKELPLLANGAPAADEVLWQLAARHQWRFSVAQSPGAALWAVAAFACQLGAVAEGLANAVAASAPELRQRLWAIASACSGCPTLLRQPEGDAVPAVLAVALAACAEIAECAHASAAAIST